MGRVVHSEFIDEHEIKLQRHEREIGLGRLELESLALACVVLYRSLCLSHPVIVAPVLHKAPQLIKIGAEAGPNVSSIAFYTFCNVICSLLLRLRYSHTKVARALSHSNFFCFHFKCKRLDSPYFVFILAFMFASCYFDRLNFYITFLSLRPCTRTASTTCSFFSALRSCLISLSFVCNSSYIKWSGQVYFTFSPAQ